MPSDLAAQLEAWRAQLLDTTGRNRLINFRSGRGGGILLCHPDAADLWHRLVVKGRALVFPWQRDLIELPEEEDENAPLTPARAQQLLEQCRLSPKLRDDHLLTEMPDKKLGQRLTRLALNARESLTEQGVTTLFVAFGFLRWFDSLNSDHEYRSPLLLVPVELDRVSVQSPWQLCTSDDEILPNHTLAQRLLADVQLRLPLPDEEAGDVDDPGWRRDYFAAIEKCIQHLPRWEVLDEAALGTFHFQKLAMWEDLGHNRDRILAHPLCRAIAGDRSTELRLPPDLPSAAELDDKTDPTATHHILDADSSQHAAIVAVARGADLILEGPPGTGKSQTIANTIAEFLATGKTVLFVSEKAAALEVVQRRLTERGLGDFCLELHSHRANKRTVLEELGRCLELAPEGSPKVGTDLQRLTEARAQLNAYVRELHALRPPLGLSIWQVHGELAQLDQVLSVSRCPIPQILERDFTYLRQATELLAQLPESRAVLATRGKHSWRGCQVTAFSPTLREDIRHHLGQLASQLTEIISAAAVFTQMGLPAATWPDWLWSLENARRMISPLSPLRRGVGGEGDAVSMPRLSWWEREQRESLRLDAQSWLDNHKIADARRATLKHRLNPEAFAPEQLALAQHAAWYSKPWTHWLPTWWFLRGKIRSWHRHPPTQDALINDLKKLAEYHQAAAICRTVETERAGDVLHDANGQPDWELTLACAGVKTPDAALKQRLTEAVQRSEATWVMCKEAWAFLTERLFNPEEEVSTGIVLYKAPLATLQTWLQERSADAQLLPDWLRYHEVELAGAPLGLAPILEEATRGIVLPEDAASAFRVRFFRLWLDEQFQKILVLRQFEVERHEQLRQTFRELDRRAIATAPQRIRHQLLSRPDRPSSRIGIAPESSELGILLREVHKKRRHLPLRKLIAALPNLLPRLKPCLMMSPLAVSTYFDTPDLLFDLVIFDEASQVRPHDAICAIYRGRQVLVAGDPKQLPPTSFFERGSDLDAEADETEANITDYESVLDVCGTLGMLRRRLRWHYRSRREGLIAFANHHIYNNELVTFPSVHDLREQPAVRLLHLPEGRWRSGAGGGYNAIEAQRVAELVLDHCLERPQQSLGVIAFSQRQQLRILDELEEMLRDNPELEEFFDTSRPEPFFVKNLENVQGDERAAIILSVAYGPDEETGKVAMRFGPLNRTGGERRLNVAVTRAREQMTVVSSLHAHDIDLTRTSAEGARLLRAYLDFAERGPESLGGTITSANDQPFESPFEQEVSAELTRQGLTVHHQIGCSGYRIDLAIVDPQIPGRYLLAVECDGASYHSSATARDRDRLRQEVLESLGWRICRIWSTDWVRQRAAQVQRVLKALEQAQRGDPLPAAPKSPKENVQPLETSTSRRGRPAATPSYDSIDRVPEKRLREEMIRVLRTCGATEASELIQATSRQLGFSRVGPRIRARLEEVLESLQQAGEIGPTADQRLQVLAEVRG